MVISAGNDGVVDAQRAFVLVLESIGRELSVRLHLFFGGIQYGVGVIKPGLNVKRLVLILLDKAMASSIVPYLSK